MPLCAYKVEPIEHMLLRDPVLCQKLGPKMRIKGRYGGALFYSLSARVALDLMKSNPQSYWSMPDILRSGVKYCGRRKLDERLLYADLNREALKEGTKGHQCRRHGH